MWASSAVCLQLGAVPPSCPLQPVVMAAHFLCDSEALASPWEVATGIHGLLWPGDVSSKVAGRALHPGDGQAHCPVCVASGQRRPSGPHINLGCVKPVVNRGPCQSSVPSLYQGSDADTRFLASLASSPALFTGACNSLGGGGLTHLLSGTKHPAAAGSWLGIMGLWSSG